MSVSQKEGRATVEVEGDLIRGGGNIEEDVDRKCWKERTP